MRQVLEGDALLFTDHYNREAKLVDSQFKDNRHDQSVSSVLRKIIGSVVVEEPPLVESSNEREPFVASRS